MWLNVCVDYLLAGQSKIDRHPTRRRHKSILRLIGSDHPCPPAIITLPLLPPRLALASYSFTRLSCLSVEILAKPFPLFCQDRLGLFCTLHKVVPRGG